MKRTTILLGIILLTLCAACSAAPTLNGTNWSLVTIDGVDIPANVEVTLSLKDGQAGGNAGCNGYGSEYTQKGEQLTFTAALSTMMYCEGIMEVESGYLAALPQIRFYKMEGGKLLLLDDSFSTRLIFSPQ
jgi:heat shock protein HslJ